MSETLLLAGNLLVDPARLPEPGWVRVEGARIAEIGYGDAPESARAGDVGSLICPGFIDAHLHLPQIDSIGQDNGDLLTWLKQVIYPAELEWANQDHANGQIDRALSLLHRAGTLGFAGYLTSHPHDLDAIRRRHPALPLRAIVGQAAMDRNSPAGLVEHPLAEPPPDADRLRFSLNPRFAVACSESLLAEAGRLAADGRFIQTHLAEQTAECALVRDLFPGVPHYTGVYDRFGLLTERSLLAHCLHLSEEEWRLIADRGSVVVHCPTANTFLRSGLFDLDAAERFGVRLALGSDIAAGPDVAMPKVARAMIEVAKIRRMTVAPSAGIPSPAEVWSLITRGNADALGFTDAGRLEPGAAADLLVLKPPFAIDKHLIGRLLHTWRDDYITHRMLAGRLT